MKQILILACLALPLAAAQAQTENSCSDKHKIFMVPSDKTPKPITKLGTDPQFPPLRHLSSEDDVYSKLKAMGTSPRYRTEINGLFTAMGYDGVNDPEFTTASISKTQVPFGAIGMLGDGSNSYVYSILVIPGMQNVDCWKVASKNNMGCDMYFMNECGNAFYYSNPPAPAVVSMNTVAPHYGEVKMKIKVYARYKHQVCGCCAAKGDDMMNTDVSYNKPVYVEDKLLIDEKSTEVDHVEAGDDPTYAVKKVYIDVDKATYKKLKKHEREHEDNGSTGRNYAMQ